MAEGPRSEWRSRGAPGEPPSRPGAARPSKRSASHRPRAGPPPALGTPGFLPAIQREAGQGHLAAAGWRRGARGAEWTHFAVDCQNLPPRKLAQCLGAVARQVTASRRAHPVGGTNHELAQREAAGLSSRRERVEPKRARLAGESAPGGAVKVAAAVSEEAKRAGAEDAEEVVPAAGNPGGDRQYEEQE